MNRALLYGWRDMMIKITVAFHWIVYHEKDVGNEQENARVYSIKSAFCCDRSSYGLAHSFTMWNIVETKKACIDLKHHSWTHTNAFDSLHEQEEDTEWHVIENKNRIGTTE